MPACLSPCLFSFSVPLTNKIFKQKNPKYLIKKILISDCPSGICPRISCYHLNFSYTKRAFFHILIIDTATLPVTHLEFLLWTLTSLCYMLDYFNWFWLAFLILDYCCLIPLCIVLVKLITFGVILVKWKDPRSLNLWT